MQLSLILPGAGIAFLLNLILTPVIIRISHRNNWYDQLDHRKIHTEDTPRLGGVGFFLSFLLTALVLTFLLPIIDNSFITMRFFSNRNILLFLGFFIVHGLGLVDDFVNIRAIYKLIGQIVAGALVAVGGALIDGIYLPGVQWVLPLGPMSGAITIFWLISISNALNLIDGLDGLAGGTGVIAASGIGMVHVINGNLSGALFSFMLVGALLAFLVFNKPKAKVFMGDSGSLFLGFALGALAFIGAGDGGTDPSHFQAGFIITITVLIVPIIDMVAAIMRRIRERKPIHHPDKEHLHHKLLAFGFSTGQILAMVHGVNLLMTLSVIGRSLAIHNGNSLLAADLFILGAWLVTAGLFTWLHFANKARKKQA